MGPLILALVVALLAGVAAPAGAAEFALLKRAAPVFAGQFGLAGDPTVIRDGARLRLYYTCPEPAMERGAICAATSSDGVTWTPVPVPGPLAGLVLRGTLGTWAETLETAAILRTATGYRLFYSGYNEHVAFPSSAFAAIGVSQSSDGVTFTPVSAPVLTASPGGYDNDALFSPTVLQTGGTTVVMLYAGHCYSDCRAGPSLSILGAVSSNNGQTWSKVATPVLTARPEVPWMGGGASEPGLIRGPDGWVYLFFNGSDPITDIPRIGVARSRSPLGPWEVYADPILTPTPGSFDAAGVLAPSVLIEGSLVRIWYLAVSTAGQFSIGYATANWPALQALFP